MLNMCRFSSSSVFWFPGISQGYACGFELQTLQGDVHLFIKETHICFCLNFLSKPTQKPFTWFLAL